MNQMGKRKRSSLRQEAERLRRLMEEVARQSSGEAREEEASFLKVLCFRLAQGTFALPLADLDEVLAPPPMSRVPFSAPHVMGVASLRGEVVPILDLRRVFSVEARPPGERSRILVVGKRADRAGLLVDEVAEVARLRREEIEPAPAGRAAEASYLKGVLDADDVPIGIVDLERLLDGLKGRAA